jgi:hypothetical protein
LDLFAIHYTRDKGDVLSTGTPFGASVSRNTAVHSPWKLPAVGVLWIDALGFPVAVTNHEGITWVVFHFPPLSME